MLIFVGVVFFVFGVFAILGGLVSFIFQFNEHQKRKKALKWLFIGTVSLLIGSSICSANADQLFTPH